MREEATSYCLRYGRHKEAEGQGDKSPGGLAGLAWAVFPAWDLWLVACVLACS